MDNIFSTLNEKLLLQPFAQKDENLALLAEYRFLAYGYSKLENSIAVLSDLKSNKSYVYNGGIASELGITESIDVEEIDSIWEDKIFNRVHPDDLTEKYLLELQFFHFIKTLPVKDRHNYHISSNMRMMNKEGSYVNINHRMFYVSSYSSGNLWLSLCLYNYSYGKTVFNPESGIIANSATGEIIKADKQKCSNILSDREKEVLLLIEKGKLSKEIAVFLSISKNTVDRHRQNILEKLRVKNSIEACRAAKLMGLL